MNRKTQTLTVASKHPNVSSSGEELEEIRDDVNTAVCTVDKMSTTSDKKCGSFTQSFLPVAVSWVILVVILALHIYFISVISENNKKLTAENQKLKTNLTGLNNTLSAENERLRREKDDQTVIIRNLTQEDKVSKMKVEELTAENQKLKTEKNKLTIIQQIIDDYCPIKDGTIQCKPCPDGWFQHQSNCYLFNNPDTAVGLKTWEEAQEDCRGKNSDLAVIVNEDEKRFTNWGLYDYWIGLRVEAGKWKWIDGSDLTEKSWMTQPADNGYCGISVPDQGWKSVRCGDKKRWICKKKALSV